MEDKQIHALLAVGETVAVEFKRCGNGIENDVYQTVCSFLNRFGGDIFLGVLDDGTISGLPEKAAPDMARNFISAISNPDLFSPTVYLVPEILTCEGKTIIHIHISPSAEVHRYKRVIYDRVGDADVKVTSTSQIAQMYIRKQNIFTEQKIYPYVSLSDLRLDLLPRLRQMAVNNSGNPTHPWMAMTDEEMLRSAHLYGMDRATGEKGYNLAAVMLLGKDDVIGDILPAYMTDALLRTVNTDRYDDREIVRTNLVESYGALLQFGRKHLPDRFYLEGAERKSLRSIILREMIANTLIHREYTSAYQAKFVIERKRMYVENANRASQEMVITPENVEPTAKNPIIAAFFRMIGFADQLGSGVRNLFRYSRYYGGGDPEFEEGDLFRIQVPLDEAMMESFLAGNEEAPEIRGKDWDNMGQETTDQGSGNTVQGREISGQGQEIANQGEENTNQGGETANQDWDNHGPNRDNSGQDQDNAGQETANQGQETTNQGRKTANQASETANQGQNSGQNGTQNGKRGPEPSKEAKATEEDILKLLAAHPSIRQKAVAETLQMSFTSVKYYIARLRKQGRLARDGTSQKGVWVVKE